MGYKIKIAAALHVFLFGCLFLSSASGENSSTKISPFSMTQVRLLDGPFKASQDINRRYLDSFDADMLLKNFRVNAKLPAPGKSMAGWEAPDCPIRGHFTGHYLSASFDVCKYRR